MTREEKEETGEYLLKMARLLEYGCYQRNILLNAVHIIDESLEQESRWIPVSERMPEDYEEVIASVNHEYVYPEARYSKEFGWEWAAESCSDYWADLKGVDAWMPLPEAYKPESEDKE